MLINMFFTLYEIFYGKVNNRNKKIGEDFSPPFPRFTCYDIWLHILNMNSATNKAIYQAFLSNQEPFGFSSLLLFVSI